MLWSRANDDMMIVHGMAGALPPATGHMQLHGFSVVKRFDEEVLWGATVSVVLHHTGTRVITIAS